MSTAGNADSFHDPSVLMVVLVTGPVAVRMPAMRMRVTALVVAVIIVTVRWSRIERMPDPALLIRAGPRLPGRSAAPARTTQMEVRCGRALLQL